VTFKKLFFISILFLICLHDSKAQYIEEIGSLENIYESKARAVLNTILRPTDYTIVVAIEMDRDEKKLQEFHQDLEVQYLPGMPLMGDSPVIGKAANKLHEMKARTDITIVLLKNINPDTEKVIKDLLSSKLHLDIAAGDIVNLRRLIQPGDTLPETAAPDLLPDLGWKTWSLILILSLVALSGLMFWAWRRGRTGDAEPKKNFHENIIPPEPDKAPESPSGTSDPAVAVDSQSENDEKPIEIDLVAVREHILTMAINYPQLVSRAIAEYTLNNSASNAAVLMDFLGWDISKKHFSEVPAMAWGRIGREVKERNGSYTKSELESAVSDIYRSVLAAYVEHEASADEQNPFSFILKMREEERSQILDKESANNIAVLCLHSPPEVTAGVVSSLEPDKRVRVLAELSRIEKLPHAVVQSVLQSFMQRLQDLKSRPEPKVEGAGVLAKVVRGMHPEEELDLLDLFARDNPEELNRLRRVILLFEDLKLVPSDIVAEAMGGLEVDTIYAALFRTGASFQKFAIETLPERKAAIIERELNDNVVIPPRRQVAEARREICQKIEALLAIRSIRIADLTDGNLRSLKSV
jgi:flagellar motor switch protein FliG